MIAVVLGFALSTGAMAQNMSKNTDQAGKNKVTAEYKAGGGHRQSRCQGTVMNEAG